MLFQEAGDKHICLSIQSYAHSLSSQYHQDKKHYDSLTHKHLYAAGKVPDMMCINYPWNKDTSFNEDTAHLPNYIEMCINYSWNKDTSLMRTLHTFPATELLRYLLKTVVSF